MTVMMILPSISTETILFLSGEILQLVTLAVCPLTLICEVLVNLVRSKSKTFVSLEQVTTILSTISYDSTFCLWPDSCR